jgi:hypothetical protein
MAHNNKTPASVLTAPLLTPRAIVAHVPQMVEEKKPNGTVDWKWTGGYGHEGRGVDKTTGVYRNPNRAARKKKAIEKRRNRNKGGKHHDHKKGGK